MAFEILLRVEQEESYASELLHSDRFATLDSRDHGLATELAMGVLRWRALLDERIVAASSRKFDRLDAEVLTALRLGAYQLQFLTRVPARAAIFESVELVKASRKRSAAPFVNAVLRKVSKAEALDAPALISDSPDSLTLARNSAHPPWLVARWTERYGFDVARSICAYDQIVPDTAIHIYDGRSLSDSDNAGGIEAELAAAGVAVQPGRLLSAARRLRSGDITQAPAYRENRLSIQDEGSQLVAMIVGREQMPQDGSMSVDRALLDCCAAPGGKTALLARLNPREKVFATELHPHRARLLHSLIRSPNVRVVAADACVLPFTRQFERILADVPCSGTGTLGRNPEIKWRLKAEDIRDLQARQQAILKSALAQLAVSGRLVYSTCSLEREENDAVIEAALHGSHGFAIVDLKKELEELRREIELCWDDIASLVAGPYLRTIPGVHPCDGFFAAMIERRS